MKHCAMRDANIDITLDFCVIADSIFIQVIDRGNLPETLFLRRNTNLPLITSVREEAHFSKSFEVPHSVPWKNKYLGNLFQFQYINALRDFCFKLFFRAERYIEVRICVYC